MNYKLTIDRELELIENQSKAYIHDNKGFVQELKIELVQDMINVIQTKKDYIDSILDNELISKEELASEISFLFSEILYLSRIIKRDA